MNSRRLMLAPGAKQGIVTAQAGLLEGVRDGCAGRVSRPSASISIAGIVLRCCELALRAKTRLSRCSTITYSITSVAPSAQAPLPNLLA
jgi:hypothetical protein